jgi:hypothetical protein
MKLTAKQLRKMIKEELGRVTEDRTEEEQAYIDLGAEVSEMTLKYYQVPLEKQVELLRRIADDIEGDIGRDL